MLHNTELSKELGDNATKLVMKKFLWSKEVKDLEKIYY